MIDGDVGAVADTKIQIHDFFLRFGSTGAVERFQK